MKKITAGFTSILAIASLIIAGPVFAATVIISPASQGSWAFQTNNLVDGVGTFVTGPAVPPLGSGSVELSTGTNGSTFSAIYNTAFDGQQMIDLANVNLANLSASYATYVPTGASAPSYPKLIVDVNINTATTTILDELTFDPRNGQSQTPAAGVWQTWDAKGGIWNSSICGNGTLGQYITNCLGLISNAVSVSVRTRADGTGGVRLQVGPNASSDQLTGYVDDVTLGLNGTSTTYDFENIVPLPPGNRLDDKDDCKKGEWAKFDNPTFRNQGSCIKSTHDEHQDGHQDENNDGHHGEED